ncbi:flagellar biosynthetic protein FlhB [Caldalkalibacillus uzonensis]|uniref:Flagellar biosynthetic protein FlhB n=1 Tax=Caldalkalibacillus uzonensis TaxID=353224 RepID=A0ABU0CN25_9BACI|nr:flagellar biosynthesis protein FlhB [Caldalkalibacillus uzonensis]MDQ0337279.1 flagellar biosynthetic protein FlhB [Caldalkalibacillus uzonensis]
MDKQRLPLQFFAEDSQEKTEKATPRKREEVRRKGQVAKSSEVPTALILLFVFILLFFIGEWMLTQFKALYVKSLTQYIHQEVTVQMIPVIFQELSFQAAKVTAPVMLMALVAGVLGNYIQVGFLFSTEPLKMKLERINPLKGFKRIFSTRALVELLKSLIKVTLVGTVVFTLLMYRREDIFQLSQAGVGEALALLGRYTFQLGLSVAIVLLVLSMLDYLYQKYEFEKNIRMSKQEMKDEHKRTEGDPLIKSKIKERQRQMAMRRMMQQVPLADVILTNPTHYAVALKYDAEQMDAPRVVAKGTGFVALKIKEIGEAHGVTVVENKHLARALYAQVEIGEEIPEHLFQAVAEVLAYVYRLKGKV